MMTAITNVWTALMQWWTGIFPNIEAFFYDSTANSLTFMGTLAVIMAGVSLVLLVFNLIRSFLPMRG